MIAAAVAHKHPRCRPKLTETVRGSHRWAQNPKFAANAQLWGLQPRSAGIEYSSACAAAYEAPDSPSEMREPDTGLTLSKLTVERAGGDVGKSADG
jgi:hypothetical protein